MMYSNNRSPVFLRAFFIENWNMKYIQGDVVAGVDVASDSAPNDSIYYLPHVCNDEGIWGSGVVIPIKSKFPEAYREHIIDFEKCKSTNVNFLGRTQIVQVKPNLFVVNMVAQKGIGGVRPLRYDCLATCMSDLREHAKNQLVSGKRAFVYAPKFGSYRAGGNWDFIDLLINDFWEKNGIDVTIYEFLR